MEVLIDIIVAGFLAAIETALNNLVPVGVAVLGTLALITYAVRYWPLVMSAGAGLGDVLAGFLLLVMGLAITLWITQNIIQMGDALYEAASTLGLQAASGSVDAAQLRNPSFILTMHKDVTRPLETFIARHTSVWAVTTNAPTLFSFWLAEIVIYLCFVGISIHVAMIVIEFYLALAAAALLVPCVVFQPSATLGEWVVGWVLGNTVRVFLVTLVVGIAVPLMNNLVGVGGGQDPKWVEVLGLLGGTGLFGIIAWTVPGRAANVVGHGLSLTAGTIAGAAASSLRWAQVAGGAIRGSSRLLQRA